ncbi:MAG: outer membrane lipoprotein-sorting protein [Spirochaetes bacterium]|nr:outer membrane lipoprotein-sorting protein [Spirochaetota bacterium]
MKKIECLLKILTLLFFVFITSIFAIEENSEALEILNKIDNNKVFESVYYKAILEIKRGKNTLLKSFEVYAKNKNFFIKFTNKEDYNVKYLKKDGNLIIYFPEANDILTISGSMLKQSFMGSDLTYEDITSNDKLIDLYKIEEYKNITIDNKNYIFISLIAKVKNVPYFKQELFIDPQNLTIQKINYFDLALRKIKEIHFLKYENFKNRIYPTETIIKDPKREDYYSKFKILEAKFDINIDESIFTIQNLYK